MKALQLNVQRCYDILTCVYSDMHVVGDPLVEALAAILTAILLPVAMNLHVRTQITTVVEVFAALRTRRCEFSCSLVHAAMVFVVPKLAELFPTFSTLERLLSRVSP